MCAVLLEPDVGTQRIFSSVPHSELYECYPAPFLSSLSLHKKTTYFSGESSPKKRETKATFHHFGLQ